MGEFSFALGKRKERVVICALGAVLDFRTGYREDILSVRTVDRWWGRGIPWSEDPVYCSAGGMP